MPGAALERALAIGECYRPPSGSLLREHPGKYVGSRRPCPAAAAARRTQRAIGEFIVMTVPTPSLLETRRHQIFPMLERAEIERLRRFGTVHTYAAGEPLAKA